MHKAILNKYVAKYIPNNSKGRKLKVPLWRILKAIFYKIKTGVQWYLLPLKELFGKTKVSYQTVYYHYNKWCKEGTFQSIYNDLLLSYNRLLDCSLLNLDGSHTLAKKGGDQVGYQGRKKGKTTNLLVLSDKSGFPLSISEAISGQHNDLFNIKNLVSKMLSDVLKISYSLNGLFLNADAGFDSKELKNLLQEKEIIYNIDHNKRNAKSSDLEKDIIDDELYKLRFSVEQTNAWVDNYKSLNIRYMTSSRNWTQSHYIA
ncbi:transposase, partial [Flammeovirga sp. EKP202]|uniref:transposase n=1 Tax=Flammeovirga sp. EKP202 TaxID=2770592 RepID=UPI00165F00AA